MKYIERIGRIENIYEGTPGEIMDLYNKMNPKRKFIPKHGGSSKSPEKYILTGKPDGEFNSCQPINIKPDPIFNPNIQIYCEANIDTIVDEVAKNLSKSINSLIR